ncbi:hypothetical protein DL96DRAFT_1572369 [Flagelloscypha sp. PMI_526]|nr:hypothetical protein DL96DRAFT_1572369 [Flagelloscypha sp. PMI_526]
MKSTTTSHFRLIRSKSWLLIWSLIIQRKHRELMTVSLNVSDQINSLEPYLYHTLVLREHSSLGEYTDGPLDLLLQTVLRDPPPKWLATYVRSADIPYTNSLSLRDNISILRLCSNITRLGCWLDAHEDEVLAQVINTFSALTMLELNIKHLVFLLGPNAPAPKWAPQLTHLSLTVWDHLSETEHTATIQMLNIRTLSSLTHLSVNSSDPDKFCFPLLNTSSPTLKLLVVFSATLTTHSLTQALPNFKSLFPTCGHDHRLVLFQDFSNKPTVNASSAALGERAFLPDFDGPFDDWGQLPHSSDGLSLSIWKWASEAVREGQRVFRRPVPAVPLPGLEGPQVLR